ncbi:hypothetical protein [Pelagerythrobacter rhizovicinus]|uniref:DUF4129 domain-containing protein n=1 Tax=Pelagerythrobacter rhizovicinus TaxID=2268576 RepID=A0A4Q2KMQ0_9SPHN|nr:hypothetical protein [Pelagerythrobacter rhizovicinus]RXZ65789.1 hypothetical protein ETX26_03390 [Pelagerythrobacter rhizovicinus]
MLKTRHHLRSAPIAIAAMLALGSTSASAQSTPATPTASAPSEPIVLQLPVAPTTTAPATASPSTTVATPPATQPLGVVLDLPPAPAADETEPEAAASAPRTRAAGSLAEPEPASERLAPPAAARDPAPAAALISAEADARATEVSLPAEAAAASAPPAAGIPEPAAIEPVPDAEPDWIALIALALVGLIPLTLAFLAFAWFRRRSRRAGKLEMAAAERQAEPGATAPIENEPVPVAAGRGSEPERAREARGLLDSYRSHPATGAAVVLPPELPETFEERDALLKQMIAAKPDRANPFRSTRARARRARLILQSLGRKFENVRPRIDLSEYTANWPALARRPVRHA